VISRYSKVMWGLLWPRSLIKRGKADAGAQHLGSVCVSKLVRDDAGGNAEGGGDVSQDGTQFANHLGSDRAAEATAERPDLGAVGGRSERMRSTS
jgi:hypothetical protein